MKRVHIQGNDEVSATTFDESKAEPGQRKPVQIFGSVFSVSRMLKSPPAQHGSDEHQVVTVAAAAQFGFCLEERREAALSKVGGRQSGCSTFYLVDSCSVLQAVVKWVSGETSSYTHHGQDTSEHGTQNQDLAQARVTRHTGDTVTQRRQRFRLVQHSYTNTGSLLKQSSKKMEFFLRITHQYPVDSGQRLSQLPALDCPALVKGSPQPSRTYKSQW